MLARKSNLSIEGTTICGETFLPMNGNSCYAIYTTEDRACNITLCSQEFGSMLRCNPSFILPPFARDPQRWNHWIWGIDEKWARCLLMDPKDGEIIYVDKFRDLNGDAEEHVKAAIETLLSDELKDVIVSYVEWCYEFGNIP